MVERQSLFSDVKTIQNSNSPEEKLPVQELQIGTQEYSVAETSTEVILVDVYKIVEINSR